MILNDIYQISLSSIYIGRALDTMATHLICRPKPAQRPFLAPQNDAHITQLGSRPHGTPMGKSPLERWDLGLQWLRLWLVVGYPLVMSK